MAADIQNGKEIRMKCGFTAREVDKLHPARTLNNLADDRPCIFDRFVILPVRTVERKADRTTEVTVVGYRENG
jgi:hypothetical protein